MISERSEPVAATFVEPRRMIRSVITDVAGRQILGAVGAVTASAMTSHASSDASPLKKGEIAYLLVSPDQLVLRRAKRGAFRPKPADEVIAAAPRRRGAIGDARRGEDRRRAHDLIRGRVIVGIRRTKGARLRRPANRGSTRIHIAALGVSAGAAVVPPFSLPTPTQPRARVDALARAGNPVPSTSAGTEHP